MPPGPYTRAVREPGKLTKEARRRVPVADMGDDEDKPRASSGRRRSSSACRSRHHLEEKRERGKLTINNALDEQQRERSLASLKRKREREKLKAMGIQQPRDKIVREVIIPEAITIQELSNRMTERAVDLIKFLMKKAPCTRSPT